MNLVKLSDSELYKKCCEIGAMVLKYRRQFCGMLPEVARRGLYEKYGMHSIYEFASKLAGLSHEVITEALRVDKLLEDKPLLREKLVSGEIGVTKLRAVATVATQETEKEWLKKVETMSKATLEVYVREWKKDHGQNGEPDLPGKEDDFVTLSLTVNSRTAAKMRVYKQKLEKKFKKPVNWDEALQELLKSAEKPKRKAIQQKMIVAAKPVTRYIPASVRHKLEEKYKGVCAYPKCNKPAEILHHTERFSLYPNHDPETIAPLCKAHERIAHHGLISHEEKSPEQWKILGVAEKNHPK